MLVEKFKKKLRLSGPIVESNESTMRFNGTKRLRTEQPKNQTPFEIDSSKLKYTLEQLESGKIVNREKFLETFKEAVGPVAYETLAAIMRENAHDNDENDPKGAENVSKNVETETFKLSDFEALGNRMHILHASSHQADIPQKNPEYSGKQCCAMAHAFILFSEIVPPSIWTTEIVDFILQEGNSLYDSIISLSANVPPDGFLMVRNFDVFKNTVTIRQGKFKVFYGEESCLYGSLNDRSKLSSADVVGSSLQSSLDNFFMNKDHGAAILIANQKCYAIIKKQGNYYFCNSHSCNKKGRENENGKACVIQCGTEYDLHNVCRLVTGYRNTQYTLDFINAFCIV